MVKPPARKATSSDALIGSGALGAAVLAIIAVSQSSGNSSNTSTDAMNALNADMSNAIAAQEPAPPEPLNAAGVSRGAAHYRTAFAAEGFPGAMVEAAE